MSDERNWKNLKESARVSSWADQVQQQQSKKNTKTTIATKTTANPKTTKRKWTKFQETTNTSTSTGRLLGSTARRDKFEQCVSTNMDDRKKYSVQDVKYDNVKLTPKQLGNIRDWASARWSKNPSQQLMTHAGMMILEKELLCRFLRPSELIKLMTMMDETVFIHEVRVPILPEVHADDLVGAVGDNVYKMTKEYQLLYVWYHAKDHTLVMYAIEHGYKGKIAKKNIESAIKFLSQKKYVNKDRKVVWKMKSTPLRPGSEADEYMKKLRTATTATTKSTSTSTSRTVSKSTTRAR